MGSGDPTGRALAPWGNEGSFYYDDLSNAYANPALIIENSSSAVVEKSNLPGTTAQASLFAPVYGKHHAGLILNRVASLPDQGPSADNRNGVTYVTSNTMRPAELAWAYPFSSFTLGAKVGYAARKQQREGNKEEDTQLTVGAKIGNLYPVIKSKLYGKSKYDGRVARILHFGSHLRYKFEAWTLYAGADWKRKKRDSDILDTDDAFGAGISKKIPINAKTAVYAGGGVWRATTERHNIIPLDIAAEHEIEKWLTVRGGFTYHLIDYMRGESLTTDPTSARIGATLKFAPVDFDFVIGSNSNRIGAASATLETSNDPNTQNFGFNDALFTAASLTARW